MIVRIAAAVACTLTVVAAPATAQTSATWAAVASNQFRVVPGITYLTASNWEAKLDVYTPTTPGPHPVVLHIHGGGWTGGSRESVVLRALPYLEMGFAVVNVSYRLARVAQAPRRRRGLPVRASMGGTQREGIRLRRRPHRGDGVLRRRASGVDDRHADPVGGPRSSVSR